MRVGKSQYSLLEIMIEIGLIHTRFLGFLVTVRVAQDKILEVEIRVARPDL